MKSELELLKILNKCVFADEDSDKIRLNHERLSTLVPDKSEQTAISHAIESDPPTFIPYRDRFCVIRYAPVNRQGIAIIVDDDGKAVMVLHRNKNSIIWEEEHPV